MTAVWDTGSLRTVYRLDNTRRWLPVATFVLIITLLLLFIWFLRGGSFKLYASVFFSLYYLTRQVWLSVILMGVLQNLVFLPLRLIGLKLSTSLKEFEEELEDTRESDQYILFSKRVREGNLTVIFYIFNFIVNAIAFISAGRIFLIDFYSRTLNPHYLYNFVPYPDYPLRGTDFFFPFFRITETTALPWHNIWSIWLFLLVLAILPRLLWRLVRPLFTRNRKILSLRINYNRLFLTLGSILGTLFILSLIFLRYLPTAAEFRWLIADLTRQNTTFNFITAVGTFITTLHAGYFRNDRLRAEARKAGIPPPVIARVFTSNMRRSFNNAVFLGVGAFLVTNHIPCAFELSVATFEILYILSPYTFDKLLNKMGSVASPPPAVAVPAPAASPSST